MRRADFLIVIALAGLAACSTPSSILVDKASPVQSVTVLAFTGYAASQGPVEVHSAAIAAQVPATFMRNGVKVVNYRALKRPVEEVAQLQQLLKEPGAGPAASHALVINSLSGGMGPYEAVLWNTATQQLVWKAGPIEFFQGRPDQQAQGFAAALLRAMHKDAVIVLPTGHPIGEDGQKLKGWF